ncbi:MAG: hypothetical protein KF819_36025 [Labilithrix sp.]|nr:hypothetical protein [Labilithrix sp.]
MKTTLIVAALLATSTFACAASSDGPDESEVAVETSGASPQMINQGKCTPAQLAMGAWEVDGICFSGGGAGGGGGSTGACFAKCDSASSKCEAQCEARGGATACFASCYRQESLCYAKCR